MACSLFPLGRGGKLMGGSIFDPHQKKCLASSRDEDLKLMGKTDPSMHLQSTASQCPW